MRGGSWGMNMDWLTVEEIEQIAIGFKDDLTREGKRCVRRKNLDRALAVFMAEEYIDQFVDTLRLRAKSHIEPREPKKRIRKIFIPDLVKNAQPVRVPFTQEQKEAQKHTREVVEAARFKGTPKRY